MWHLSRELAIILALVCGLSSAGHSLRQSPFCSGAQHVSVFCRPDTECTNWLNVTTHVAAGIPCEWEIESVVLKVRHQDQFFKTKLTTFQELQGQIRALSSRKPHA
eukprot:TRINITY_DN5055_c0_g1_i2.p1 TRINITY_DN5055_c0_g1~~TRINITY_DN5055_c0_g1_i2.p1  ORF type:complete len:106 (-),score=0.07 TRINITY_DN5055_c0_g1_i2:131-448(-)